MDPADDGGDQRVGDRDDGRVFLARHVVKNLEQPGGAVAPLLPTLARRVTRGRVELELSAREYELLEYFLRHVNETLARESIARGIWKEAGPVETNIIDVYVSYLRKKIERPDLPPLPPRAPPQLPRAPPVA